MSPDYREVVIVGAGFSGIGLAIKLIEGGFEDFVILEAGDGVGGAWHWNTYPEVAVDIPSFAYQFSFARSTRWTRTASTPRSPKPSSTRRRTAGA